MEKSEKKNDDSTVISILADFFCFLASHPPLFTLVLLCFYSIGRFAGRACAAYTFFVLLSKESQHIQMIYSHVVCSGT